MGMPEILVKFSQLASSAVRRSEKGIVCLIVKDDTAGEAVNSYDFNTDVVKEEFTEENYKIIQDVFLGTPYKVIVVKIATEKTFADAVSLIDTLKFNWLGIADNTSQQELVTYVKSKNAAVKTRQIKAVVYKATTTDNMHIVNFTNSKVKKVGEAEIDGWKYIGRILGVLAGLPFTRSCTYLELQDLESVVEPEDVNTAIDDGEFVIINDFGEPKIARGVNSLKNLSSGITEDMKKITIVEAMDLILEDVSTTFKRDYIGKHKNSYDNQSLFISAINGYFRKLQKESVLDEDFDNSATVDVEGQREKWIERGKTEAAEWDDDKVKKMTISSFVCLLGNIKILDAIEDLEFNISIE